MDKYVMRVALMLARRGMGRTNPNPMVGAVIVKSGRVIGQAAHCSAGNLSLIHI